MLADLGAGRGGMILELLVVLSLTISALPPGIGGWLLTPPLLVIRPSWCSPPRIRGS